MEKGWRRSIVAIVLGGACLMNSGCAYMNDRGNDARDMLDLGITVTPRLKPEVALYFDFFNLTPLGYAKMNNKILGLSNGNLGLMDYEEESWGALVLGSETKGGGEFNPNNPRQARDDQTDLDQRPAFDVGIARIPGSDNRPPPLQYGECDRALHLGWIGVRNTMRPLDMLDFILGWTTLDVMGDDGDGRY